MKTYEVFTEKYSKIYQAQGILDAMRMHYDRSQEEIIAVTIADRPDLLDKIEPANQPPVTEEEIKEEYNKLQSTVLQHNYIKELESYIEFIGLELDELAVLASAHGWKSDRYKEGEKRRKKLTSIKSLLSKLSK